MLLPLSLYALLALFTVHSEASSQASRPIKRVAHPQYHGIDIFPRVPPLAKRDSSLQFDDSFRLTLSVFEQTYHLHLSPNNHLIHPAARVTYHERDPLTGQVSSKTVPLLRESVKAYHGHVVHPEHTDARILEDIAGVAHSSYPALGWARVILHDDGDPTIGKPPLFEGAFSVNHVIHHIVTKDNYLRAKQSFDPELVEELDDLQLVIWRETDVTSAEEVEDFVGKGLDLNPGKGGTCAHDTLEYNTNPALNPTLRPDYEPSLLPYPLSFWRRDLIGGDVQTNYVDFIGQTAGCPTSQKLVYMGVAADCAYVAKYGSTANATQKILNDWNSASALYKSTLNVSLGIVELQVQSGSCPTQADPNTPWNIDCSGSGGDINHRLSLFSQWRGAKGNDGAGLWHLMSGCPTGQQVGIAWLSTLCQNTASNNPDGQIVSGTGVSTFGLTEWQVVAHEIGHNFGAIHDCDTNTCGSAPNTCCPLSSSTCNSDSKFVMNPTSQPGENNFSPCTIGNICSLMREGAKNPINSSCLVDASSKQRPLLSLKMCGNGIVEEGEDCDPGSGVTSPCCDSQTCKFKSGAKCDPLSSTCCTDQCDFAPSGKVCRASKDSACDVEEKCSGTSGNCPNDVVKPDGESCGSGDLKCASGLCTSVAKQCQSQGASMNLTDGCRQPQSTCELVCQDPKSSNSCIKLSTLMIEGSPCGFAGTCKGGKCEAGGWFQTVQAWYKRNLQIAIPVTIAAALVILLILYCGFRCICGGRRRSNTKYMQVTPAAVAPSYNPNTNYQRLGT
ncbi:hypothetical protein E1B28_003871 [Marasmius oreades]|uniref:Disintegrin and metalloproteinase domain-containing protein B n=1 Tax=Marasmius oreades TaxID=181124 RepID=A0A9P8ABR0_9AGAR|nr:uncharacterized protein E1B28_003871 [Marasmius oreades]KAG7096434.1 hypothetical protein E1B28_003871 [Marasmius oreades]